MNDYDGSFPYNSKCKVSLIKSDQFPYSEEVIVSDLFELMKEQNLPDGLLGAPRPYMFSGETLIFGGNGYEGAVGGFYSFDVKTKRFNPLTEKRLGQPGTIALSPNYQKLLIEKGDNQLLIIDINSLSSKVVTLNSVASDETLVAACEMGCSSKIGWVDENTVWYAVYKKNNTYINTFVRMDFTLLD